MCFKTEYRGRAKIAKKNIIVYKAIHRNSYGMHFSIRINRISYPYEVGMHYTETEFPKVWTFRRSIIKGNAFHSFKKLPSYVNAPIYKKEYKISKFRIPVGARYYENDRNYVSSDIIYVKDLT